MVEIIDSNSNGDSNKSLSEKERIIRATEIERTWWPVNDKYISIEEANDGLLRGELVRVENDCGYRLIGAITRSENPEPCFLRPKTAELLKMIGFEFHKIIGDDYLMAITSLYRDLALQEKLNSGVNGYISVKGTESSHLAGAAVDISLRSYYVVDGQSYRGVAEWNQDSGFNPKIKEVIIQVVKKLQESIQLNMVIEKTKNISGEWCESVLHICISPNK